MRANAILLHIKPFLCKKTVRQSMCSKIKNIDFSYTKTAYYPDNSSRHAKNGEKNNNL